MMAGVDLGQKRPAAFTLAIWDKLLVVLGEVDIGPRPDPIPPITPVAMVDFCVYLVLLAILMTLFMKMREVIVGVMVQDVEVGLNISCTILFTIKNRF